MNTAAIPDFNFKFPKIPSGPPKPMPTYEVKLEVDGEVLCLGAGFTRRYAAICRNWHIGWLGLDLPLEEVLEQKCDRQGKSWTYWPLVTDLRRGDRARGR
jgi:hypothetical protein